MSAPAFFPFQYRRSLLSAQPRLHCDGVAVEALAKRFGTPLYVYSAGAIRDRWRTFDSAFAPAQHTVCYSVKANSNLSILRVLAKLGCGFDVVSGGELERVLLAGRKAAACTVFSGVGKRADEIDLALKTGILLFNVESEEELDMLAERARKMKRVAPVGIRVNPDVSASTHPHITTGMREHKFGVPFDRALELFRRAKRERSLDPCALSAHIGSQILEVDPFREAMQRLAGLALALGREGVHLRYVDAGGGFGVDYRRPTLRNAEAGYARRCADYARAVMEPLRGLGLHLLLEPGRAIVAPAGALLTRVLYRKTNGEKTFVVVDAASNDLMRPTLYDAYHEIVPATQRPKRQSLVDVVGPVCESGDFFARDRAMPKVEQGELLAVLDAGAYGMSQASNYNSRPRPAEVLVENGRARQIRKRETVADLLRLER